MLRRPSLGVDESGGGRDRLFTIAFYGRLWGRGQPSARGAKQSSVTLARGDLGVGAVEALCARPISPL